MIKNIIIGAGFSAAITKLLVGNNSKIIGSYGKSNLQNENLIRRKSVETNKLFSSKAYSYGTLNFNLKNGSLHDRLIFGGNSNIWGGQINMKNIPKKLIQFLKKKNIHFKKLTFKNTGTCSNNNYISQLQNEKEQILTIKDLPILIEDGYMINFFNKKNKLYISIKKSNNNQLKIISVKNIFLCAGNIQILDILYRSGYLKNNDIIEFSEFKHEFKFKFLNSKFNKKTVTVRYLFSRALGHLLGIQSFSTFLKIFNFVPIFIDQNFYYKKINYKLKIINGNIIEEEKNLNSYLGFGSSIHYCNLRINKININKFLCNINKNIYGIGAAFLDQRKPGPISNDIIMDINKKIIKTK
tara:strand:- start:3459 stop:4520 length:1062 start_codon:yes stop_codon:yes gene_type:complete